jgi:hypothetical protein
MHYRYILIIETSTTKQRNIVLMNVSALRFQCVCQECLQIGSINGTHILKAYCYLDFYAINIFNTDKYPMSPGTSTSGDWLIVAGVVAVAVSKFFRIFHSYLVAVHYRVRSTEHIILSKTNKLSTDQPG